MAAGITDVLPLRDDRAWAVAAVGQVYEKGHRPESFVRVVSDGYFAAAGIPLRMGRDFTERDRSTSERVVVVNETLARTLWPGAEPDGTDDHDGRRAAGRRRSRRRPPYGSGIGGRVGNVSADAANGGLRDDAIGGANRASAGEPGAGDSNGAAADRSESAGPRVSVTFQDLVDRAVSPRRFLVVLLAGFAAFALVLASLGIYAVISFSVSQRVQEIGIRMALGASAADVQSRIVLRTLGLAAIGLALGMAASRALSRALGSLLFGVTAGDPVTFVEHGNAPHRGRGDRRLYSPPGEHPGSIRWLHCDRIEKGKKQFRPAFVVAFNGRSPATPGVSFNSSLDVGESNPRGCIVAYGWI